MRLNTGADSCIVKWYFYKKFDKGSSKENKRQLMIQELTKILKIVSEAELVIPVKVDMAGFGSHFLDLGSDKAYTDSFWKQILPSGDFSLYFDECPTVVREFGKSISQQYYLQLAFHNEIERSDFTNGEFYQEYDDIRIFIKLYADCWLPYHVINEVKKNHDFEYNHGRLKSALTDIVNLGYTYDYEQEECIAIVDGFDLDCHYYEGGISLFNFEGNTYESVLPEDAE